MLKMGRKVIVEHRAKLNGKWSGVCSTINLYYSGAVTANANAHVGLEKQQGEPLFIYAILLTLLLARVIEYKSFFFCSLLLN